MANFLQLLGLASSPDIPSAIPTIDPNTGLPISGAIINGQPAPNNVMGMRSLGNIDVTNRPVVHNPDGSISTVRSMSFGNDKGEVLVPTVSDDGRILSDKDAMALYQQTGRNLGVFDTPEHATAYAQTLHNQQAERYAPQNPSNVLQAIGGSPDAPQPASIPQTPQQSTAPAEAPRQRRSLLDTVGRISDVLARVGGAEAIYQPTLDARQDRSNALADRQRGIDLDALRRTLVEQQIAAGGDEATNRSNAMLGAAARGLQAIQRRGGDVNAAWPIIARQAGIPEARAQELGQIFAQNPNAIEAISALTGQAKEYGMQPFFSQGADGQLHAYQLGRDGTVQPIELGAGETPIDPIKFVNTGGAQVGVGERSGKVQRILPNSVSPDTAANNRTKITIAELPSKTQGANAQKNEQQRASIAAITSNLNDMRRSVENLKNMGALTTPGGNVISNAGNYAATTGLGQSIGRALGTKAQAERDNIKSIAQSTLLSMRSALGTAASQLNSDRDVQNALAAINDPGTSYQNMISAIDRLQGAFTRASNAMKSPAAAPQRIVPQGSQGVPAVGTRKGGYEFLGGNPADRNSWRKVQ